MDMDMDSRDRAPPADQDAPDTVSGSAGGSAVVAAADPPDLPHAAETQTVEGNPYYEFFLDFAPSVVTVACILSNRLRRSTLYGTGFILLSEKTYTVVFTKYSGVRPGRNKKYVIFFEPNEKIEAEVLAYKEFLILIVRDNKERTPVRFSVDPVGYEEVATIGAMGGATLHVDTAVINTLVGVLGLYRGEVSTKSCAARDAHGVALEGFGRYFRVKCFGVDQTVTLMNVDEKDNQTAHRLVSAPVFRLTTGEMVGLVYSASDWCDVKMGLHTKDILSGLAELFKSPRCTTWEEGVKKMAERSMRRIASSARQDPIASWRQGVSR